MILCKELMNQVRDIRPVYEGKLLRKKKNQKFLVVSIVGGFAPCADFYSVDWHSFFGSEAYFAAWRYLFVF